MLIFKDLITGDDLFTDASKYTLEDGIVYKVPTKKKTEKSGIDDSLIGGNKSQEEEAEEMEDGAVSNWDLFIDNQYVENQAPPTDKTTFLDMMKTYIKSVKKELKPIADKNDDSAECKEAKEALAEIDAGVTKKVIALSKIAKKDIKVFEFYWAAKGSYEAGMPIILIWEEQEDGDEKPFFLFWKAGIKEEKA